jgi:PKD repeat protein
MRSWNQTGSKGGPSRWSVVLLIGSVIMASFAGIGPMGAEGAGGSFGGGSGTEGDPYLIEDVWDLQNISSDLSAHYVLENDIDASATTGWNGGAGFAPIGTYPDNQFTGSLDGRGYNITGLFINRSGTDYVGLLDYLGHGGAIVDVSLIDLDITGQDNVGGLVGKILEGSVSHSYVTGSIHGGGAIGGLAGYNQGTVSNSSTTGSVNGEGDQVGGLVGLNDQGSVSNSSATGNVNGKGDEVGGLVGRNAAYSVSNSYATGNVSGSNSVGGLVGSNSGSVSRSYATGNESGNWYIGGLVGWNGGSVSSSNATGNINGNEYIGGLVGGNYGSVSDSYATGNVNGSSSVGGLMGGNYDSVSDSYATGNVSGNKYVGGLVGEIPSGSVSNSYATGNVNGTVNVGGLVGGIYGSVSDSFWDTETSGQTTSAGGSGKATAEMKTLRTFTDAGWNFTHIWCMIESVTYPQLRWQNATPPTADAGPDQTVDEGTLVTFDGSSSTDDVEIANYTWVFNDGTGNIALYGVVPSHTFNVPGIFIVTLRVTNNFGLWDTDALSVTANDIIPPVAEAGPDWLTIGAGGTCTFDGTSSTDNAGIVNYTWTFDDGTGDITLYGATISYTFNVPGVYNVTLNVTDAAGLWDVDMIRVAVCDDTPPTADAGPDQNVDEDTLVTFNGSASTDNVGIINYTWTFNDGTSDITLFGAAPSHTFNVPGIYTVDLHVKDRSPFWDNDMMTVTVKDITPPVADAGPDQTIDENTLQIFDCSASSDNVGIIDYTWTFNDSTDDFTLHGAAPSHTFNVPGIYTVTLNVTDAVGLWDIGTMTVTVNDITPPVADAGPDQAIDEDTQVIFNGGASMDNVGIVDYTWTFNDGTGNIALHGAAPPQIFNVPGIYIVTLNVTDAAGLWDSDMMTLTVKDTTSPIANAGSDQRVAIGSTVVLNGSMSTDNGRIKNYTWAFTYGGVGLVIEGEMASFKFDEAGEYPITLTVIDQAGNIGNDIVTITGVDKGTVSSIVLDGEGKPVEGANVTIMASDGKSYTITTGPNGSFSLELPQGPFTWKISKHGYEPISGTSSMGALEEKALDLSGSPLTKETTAETSPLLFIIPAVVLILLVIGIVVFLLTRKKKGGPVPLEEKGV